MDIISASRPQLDLRNVASVQAAGLPSYVSNCLLTLLSLAPSKLEYPTKSRIDDAKLQENFGVALLDWQRGNAALSVAGKNLKPIRATRRRDTLIVGSEYGSADDAFSLEAIDADSRQPDGLWPLNTLMLAGLRFGLIKLYQDAKPVSTVKNPAALKSKCSIISLRFPRMRSRSPHSCVAARRTRDLE